MDSEVSVAEREVELAEGWRGETVRLADFEGRDEGVAGTEEDL